MMYVIKCMRLLVLFDLTVQYKNHEWNGIYIFELLHMRKHNFRGYTNKHLSLLAVIIY